MADRSVKGRIVYAGTDTGIKGLEVHAFDVDPIVSDDHLGKDTTDGEGKFKITYSESDYRVWFTSNNPDIRVRIYGPVSRLLFETPVKENVAEEPFDLQTIEIHKNHIGEESDANSWLVTNATLNRLKGDTVPVTQGNQLDWLVDGLTLFPAITDTLLTAQQSISFMNLNFWVAGSKESLAKNDLLITKFESGFISTNPPLHVPVKGQKAQQIMKDKANAGAKVRIVVGDIPLTTDDTVDLVKGFFAGSPVNIRALYIGVSLLHSKAVIVDHTAFVIGSTFSQSYFNDQNHFIRDATHRGALMHDVSVKMTGPGVKYVNEAFATVWNAADPAAAPLLFKDQAPQNDGTPVGVQVLRTLPGKMFKTSNEDQPKDIPHGETAILEAYQRAIANAVDYIYIEDQYFTNPDIARALIIQMKKAPKLQLIVLVNITPDIPGYPNKQIALMVLL